eukprot:CAMPEP_0203846388 /NCGR_PEP_ID=MMETSP0359-20131031/4396_1 /ASSEMBLY_ACC=CAM_ASM_000338 /TAXON_ID=268821 /ORGANISM="Scrippsiella Hangoei, Strain SHTV-5" /LENGTH=685 /DNA_ID=CAMNT_0050761705 /DNA_START=58 /DNA_END=2115 /DNA_ORIENTATION=-
MTSAAVADNFTSREDTKKQKQLQEARAAGTAAPETDEATGKMINPHNPSFITAAPWYLNQDKPSLKHHQAWNKRDAGTNDWYRRGTKGDVKTKFAKGACENCGATTHTKIDCVERPRVVGAKWNGKNLMPDEFIEDLNLDYDGKRDRWNGFHVDDYKEIQDEWERVEQERRNRKAAEMEERAKLRERLKSQKKALKQKRKQRRRQLRRQAEGRGSDTGTDTGDSDFNDSDTDSDTDSDSDASDDEDLGEKMKDFDKSTSTVAAKDDKLRTTTRNLRIREDTAKYLLNLDVNSAYYDPKSRSMRDDPFRHLKDEDAGVFRGDNFLRSAGDAKKLTELTIFAWDAYKHGEKVHDFAQPTQAAKMYEVFKKRSENLEEEKKKELMDKYGGQEHLDVPQELIYGQSDTYVEYSRDGRVLKGRERAYVKSKFEEDVSVGNHSSIWGSWFDPVTKSWGFACCHQCMKNAYCVPLKVQESVEGVTAVPQQEQVADGQGSAVALEDAVAGGADGGDAASSGSGSDSSSSEAEAAGGGEKDVEERAQALAEKRRARALAGLKMQGASASSSSGAAASAAGAGAAAAAAAGSAERADATASAGAGSKLSGKRSSAFGHVLEDITDLDSRRVAEAVQMEKKKRKKDKESKPFSVEDERNRKYSSLGEAGVGEVSPEEYEAYRLTRSRGDDPMAKFM